MRHSARAPHLASLRYSAFNEFIFSLSFLQTLAHPSCIYTPGVSCSSGWGCVSRVILVCWSIEGMKFTYVAPHCCACALLLAPWQKHTIFYTMRRALCYHYKNMGQSCGYIINPLGCVATESTPLDLPSPKNWNAAWTNTTKSSWKFQSKRIDVLTCGMPGY